MMYKDFCFPEDPKAVEIREERAARETLVPFAGSKLTDLGAKRRIVTGEGAFSGQDCLAAWEKLQRVYSEGGEGLLLISGCESFPAVFHRLRLLGPIVGDSVRYAFGFTEASREQEGPEPRACFAEEGETLWDYARRYQISIERLIAANPQIRDIEVLTSGEVVHVP